MTEKKREWADLELDPGHGVLFQATSDNPKAPEFKGSIEIPPNLTGRLDISLWSYTSKAGKPYLKVIVQEPYKRGGDDDKTSERGGKSLFRAQREAGRSAGRNSYPPGTPAGTEKDPDDDFDDSDIPF